MPLNDDKLFVVGHSNATGAASYLRTELPLRAVKRNALCHSHMLRKEQEGDIQEKAILNADLLISAHGTDELTVKTVLDLMDQGKKYLWDADDLPDGVSPLNPAYRFFGLEEVEIELRGETHWLWKDGESGFDLKRNQKSMDEYFEVLKRATALSTTQPYLGSKLKRFNKEVIIRPNVIDFRNIWKRRAKQSKDGKVRIMYMGGSSHYHDLEVVLPAFEAIAAEYPHVHFIFFGDTKCYADRVLPPERIEFHEWEGDYKMFALRLALLAPDIGVAPLSAADDFVEFNKSKSCLKWLDYAAIGVPCVASRMTPYKEVINFSKEVPDVDWNGMLASNDEDWLACLTMLVKHREARMVMGENAYVEAREEWDADVWAPVFYRQFERVANG